MTDNKSMKIWSILPEFLEAMNEHFRKDDVRWGDTWLKRTRAGQEERTFVNTKNRFDKYFNAGQPIDWLAIIGDAMICWYRERHPEIWKE
jgi:hypothetical protein